MIMTGTNYYL
ncbi:unnamed protein product [Tuber melanosporum]|uniref:(Perigord truffle) hypothetical protein n=1 Tax=Tuber melanosporum (strain Mel28) TaxID=656061 RepID=D5GLH8_TUBMM|nr:unnamed protein product [Tuber melanosporum]